ncbi:peptidoglycan DD-metalloendopeptidase family protein [Pseudoalteromonas sp. CnMc7-15]|uniref:peptidoglycan DD-metalloendopeptidase family protein n=1 Tax=unclassified Pseudoalteromonas TaxID=194690 RepID=UPI001EF6E78E|nr:peptidoglycan DD-metalloendopeptidase family protein [Pseudoalteromonas sp. CnMc7-15]MCG7567788.1 peptidoglycan DD-metalloendopeptidase family protein [Pseudoalteromonas sp. CnMc7-15]
MQGRFMQVKYTSLIVLVCLLLSACSSRNTPAPVSVLDTGRAKVSRKIHITGEHYRVQKGDTLYAIAFSANKDVREIAQINGIKPPYTIYPKQLIYIESQWLKKKKREKYRNSSKKSTKSTQKNNKKLKKEVAKPIQREYVRKQPSKKTVSKKVRSANRSARNLSWQWPAQGKVTQRFSNKENGYKGVQIANRTGTSVRAAADGVVVYAGDALRGYGNLIIVKHNDDYLSAYAHNSRLLVQEKQDVKAGQKIAEMGSSESPVTALRFEIRYRGKAVNPSKYLP